MFGCTCRMLVLPTPVAPRNAALRGRHWALEGSAPPSRVNRYAEMHLFCIWSSMAIEILFEVWAARAVPSAARQLIWGCRLSPYISGCFKALDDALRPSAVATVAALALHVILSNVARVVRFLMTNPFTVPPSFTLHKHFVLNSPLPLIFLIE